MTQTLSYREKLLELLKAYQLEEIAQWIGVTGRSVQNYTASHNGTEPRLDTKRKIDEIYTKHKEGASLTTEQAGDYQSKYIALLEKQVKDTEALEREIRANREMIEKMQQHLDVLTNSVKAVAAQNAGYQSYWMEHYPPKGITPAQVRQGIRKKSREALEGFLKEGIVL